MKKQLAYLFVASVVISSCNDHSSSAPAAVTDTKPNPVVTKPTVVVPATTAPVDDATLESAALARRLARFELPTQHLTASAQTPSVVKGNGGTQIMVVPKDMVTADGQPVTGEIDVELVEMPGIEQMIRQRAQTTSNGRLLESGGAYYVNMKSGGRQLQLKMGRTLKVMLPKHSKATMNVFYGEKDAHGVMNWTATSQQFRDPDIDSSQMMFANSSTRREGFSGGSFQQGVPDRIKQDKDYAMLYDALSSGQKDSSARIDTSKRVPPAVQRHQALAQAMYKEIAMQQFGWINCDRFLESTALTSIACTFAPADSISCAKVFLAFKSINSLMEQTYSKRFGATFANIPADSPATVIALALRKGVLYTSRVDVRIGKTKTVMLPMKKTRDSEMASVLKF